MNRNTIITALFVLIAMAGQGQVHLFVDNGTIQVEGLDVRAIWTSTAPRPMSVTTSCSVAVPASLSISCSTPSPRSSARPLVALLAKNVTPQMLSRIRKDLLLHDGEKTLSERRNNIFTSKH